MTSREKRVWLYGPTCPIDIPKEIRDNRITCLKEHLDILSKEEKLDLVRINEVQEAIEFWENIL